MMQPALVLPREADRREDQAIDEFAHADDVIEERGIRRRHVG